jgi:peptide/nickel transport system substrate-binding protein
MRITPRKALVCLSALTAAAALAACGSGNSATNAGTSASTLTVVSAPSGPFVDSYNPFSTSNTAYIEGTTSMVYEPLLYFNVLRAGQTYPWLATSWAWSNDGKTLTFQIRKGVTWSDGKPFTAADVAYTFNLIKKYPALNVNGVTGLDSASAPSATQAVLTFSAPAFEQLFAISQVLIVPQHIWSKVNNPVTYADASPVGTGPYTLQSFSAQDFILTANPHYWQPGLPKIKTLRIVDYVSNSSADLALEHGAVDWASLFIPHYQSLFVAQNAANHVWLPAQGNIFLCPNDATYPYNILAVRQALSEAINRQTVTQDGEDGFYLPDTNPTGLILPNYQQYLSPQYASSTTGYNPSAAKSLLEKAGFKPGANGMLNEPDGKPFNVQISAPTPYTDWMTDTQLLVNEMKAAGINASVNGQSLSAWTNAYTTGSYDLTFCGNFTNSDPYNMYSTMLDSSLTAKIGGSAVGDYERWNNKATDADLAEYAGTDNSATQIKAAEGIESIMVQDVPIIPLMAATAFGEYTTTHALGWPTAANPYETPAPGTPWDEVVVLRLRPAS